jgi:hypothetical protein
VESVGLTYLGLWLELAVLDGTLDASSAGKSGNMGP